jgi:adenine-specific DNA-methyltransferase
MQNKPKLELTWIGKENRPRLEPRVLIEDPEKSYHAKQQMTERDIFDNRLIFGDNLLALKALEQEFTGKVKCIFIDPPYNTGSAFTHYDDGVEHSIWLSLMRDRLELIRRLLAEDGSLWITIDDNEAHYLKVMCDEVFGRTNFVCNVVWQKKYAPQSNTKWISESHDHILLFAKNKDLWSANLLPRSEKMNVAYKNPDNDPRGPYKADNFTISLTGGQRGAQYAKTGVSANIYEITTPSGRKIRPPKGRCWGATPEGYARLLADSRIYFGPKGSNVPAIKRFLTEVQDGVVTQSVWLREEVGDNQDAKREVTVFNPTDVFSTPKPEALMRRIFELATKPGELVLDSFAGSGTTGAVAHKMGRRWIMVELGEHCHTHIIPRLKKVIDGEDPGGITEAVDWKGGGGFRYYHLASSLLERDTFGNLIISRQYNAAMLAEAMCKLMGFQYAPGELYWQQGCSTETDFIYVTTQTLTRDHLAALSEEVGLKRSLLVCCAAFRGKADAFPNLTLKKIPLAVLQKCEWGHDDYSLNVANLPKAPEPTPEIPIAGLSPKNARRRAAAQDLTPSLFDGGAE